MQIIAPTWEATVQRLAREGVIPEAWPYEPDVFDPRKNVTVGVSYLAEVMEKMSRRYPKATLKELLQYSLAGYNAGPDHSDSYYPKVVNGQISGNHETPDYVRKIIAMYKNIDKDKLGRLFVQDKAAGYTEYLSGTGEFSVAERKMAAEGKRPVAPADVPPEAGYKLPIEERVRLTRKESGKEVIFPVVETLMAEGKALRLSGEPGLNMPEPYLVFKGKDGGLMKLTDKGIEPADHLPGALKASLEDILSRKGLKDRRAPERAWSS